MKKLNLTKGTNSEDIQEMNRSLILQLIDKYGVCTRVQLSKETGLKQASITKIISSLIDLGIVKEVGLIEGEKGRRSIGISLNSSQYKTIGIMLTRKSFTVGLYDISGLEYRIYTEEIAIKQGSSTVINRMIEIANDYISTEDNVVAISIAIPGPFLKSEGKIGLITEFPGWENINLQSKFFKAFSIPVFIEHDANAAALAEWWYGKKQLDKDVLLYILANEGVGAGIISEGYVYTGSQGVAGEIGHMSIDYVGRKCSCGNYGCLERYCSTLALIHDVKENLANYPNSILHNYDDISMGLILYAMDQGDPLVEKVVKQLGEYLAYGIVNLVNVYNPNLIVLSGEIAHLGEPLLKVIHEVLKARLLPSIYENIEIYTSEFSSNPVLYGAAAIATDNFLKNPSGFLN